MPPAPPMLPKKFIPPNITSLHLFWFPLHPFAVYPAWPKPKCRCHGAVGSSEELLGHRAGWAFGAGHVRGVCVIWTTREMLPNGEKLEWGLHVTTTDSFSFWADSEFIEGIARNKNDLATNALGEAALSISQPVTQSEDMQLFKQPI